MNNFHFFLNLADYKLLINILKTNNVIINNFLFSFIKKYCSSFIEKSNGKINYDVEINLYYPRKIINYIKKNEFYSLFYLKSSTKKYFIPLTISPIGFLIIVRRILINLLVKDKGFIFHGSAISYRDKGIIFLGPNGAGKSTIVKILKKDKKINLIADDSLIVRFKKNDFYVYPTPFFEKEIQNKNKILNRGFLLKKVFFLHKKENIKIKIKKNFDDIINNLIKQTNFIDETKEKEIKNLFFFIKRVSFFDLFFSNEPNQERILINIIKKEIK